MNRNEIQEDARKYLGVPFAHQGRSLAGMDCAGLLCQVATDFGVPFEDRLGYDRVPVGQTFLTHMLKFLPINRTGLLAPGSIAVIRESRFPCHVGIFADRNGERTLIHAYLRRGQIVEERWTPSQEFGLVMVLDFPGVTD